MSAVRTGLDRIAAGDLDAVAHVRGRRVGLVAHPASIDSRFRHARDVLLEAGATIGVLFGPEHGFGGEAQDMIGVLTAVDPVSGAPVHSLYGDAPSALSPRPEHLDGLDAVVVDLQDVGARYYTFVWTAALVLRACAAEGIPTVVLDRPNPLGGATLEGAPQHHGYRSFVGLYDVPVRHAMTIGEICTMVARLEGLPDDALAVVRMHGWERAMLWEHTRLPWVPPSPNMPTPDTARVYPGGCVLEGTNLSEGRGLTRPFELWGAPFVDGAALAREVRVDGAVLRPSTFRPTFHKHAGRVCGGVFVHVTDAARFRPHEAYLRMIAAVARMAPEVFAWRTDTYEFVPYADRPAIDLLTGGPAYRHTVKAAKKLDAFLAADAEEAERFRTTREPWLLYQPHG